MVTQRPLSAVALRTSSAALSCLLLVAAGCSCGEDRNGPCKTGEARACFTGDAAKSGKGICRDGLQRCVNDAWAACEGQVLPATEICNGTDDNCDGRTDEDVVNACGVCGPAVAGLNDSCVTEQGCAGTKACNDTGNAAVCVSQTVPNECGVCAPSVPDLGTPCRTDAGCDGALGCNAAGTGSECRADPPENACGVCGGPEVPAGEPCTAPNGCGGSNECADGGTDVVCTTTQNPNACGHCGGPAVGELGAECNGPRGCHGRLVCDLERASPTCLCGPVLAEFAGTGPASGGDEFVELYNPGPVPLDATGFTLWTAANTAAPPLAASAKVITLGVPAANCAQPPIIPAHGYLLVARGGASGYVPRAGEPAPDCTYASKDLSGTRGQLWLTNSAEPPASAVDPAVVDMVGYSHTTTAFEGSGPTSDPPRAPGSLVRKAGEFSTDASMAADGADWEAGNGWDSDDNAFDFLLREDRRPRGLASQAPAGATAGGSCIAEGCAGTLRMQPDGALACAAPAPNACGVCGGAAITGKGDTCTTTAGCEGTRKCNDDGDGLVCVPNAPQNECGVCGGPPVPEAEQACQAPNGCEGVGVCTLDGTDATCVASTSPNACGHCGGPVVAGLGAVCTGARSCRGTAWCDVTTPGTRCLCGPVISQFAGTGPASTADEFIELYNPGPAPMDVTGYSLWYASATASAPLAVSTRLVTLGVPATNCTQAPIIPPHGYLLVAHADGYVPRTGEPAADCTWAAKGLAGTAGQLWLTSSADPPQSAADSRVLDMVGYGSSAPHEGAGPAHAPPPSPGSLVRKATAASSAVAIGPGGAEAALGNGFDSEDNSADFLVFSSRWPRGLGTRSPSGDGPGTACTVEGACGALMEVGANGQLSCTALVANQCGVCGGAPIPDLNASCTTSDGCAGTRQCGPDGLPVCVGPAANACGLCGGPAVEGVGDGCRTAAGCEGRLACNLAGTAAECLSEQVPNNCGLCGGAHVDGIGDTCTNAAGCAGQLACNADGDGTSCAATNPENECGVCGGPAVPGANKPCVATNGCSGTGVCIDGGTDSSCVAGSAPNACGHCGGEAIEILGAQCQGARACPGRLQCDLVTAGTRCLCGPVISQFAGTGPASNTDEFVELFNPGPNPMDVAGYTLWYAPSTSTTPASASKVLMLAVRANETSPGCTLPPVIPPHGYLLVGRGGTAGYLARTGEPAPDCVYTGADLAATRGQLWLTATATAPDSATDQTVLDMVGYGSAAIFEGSAPTHAPPGQPGSMMRKASEISTAATLAASGTEAGLGNGFDSGDNSADFLVFPVRLPRATGSQPPHPESPGASCSTGGPCPGMLRMAPEGTLGCVAPVANACGVCGGPPIVGMGDACSNADGCSGSMQCSGGVLACTGPSRNACNVCGAAVTGLGDACRDANNCDGKLVCDVPGTGTTCQSAFVPNNCGLCGGPHVDGIGDGCTDTAGCAGTVQCNGAGDGATCHGSTSPNECGLCGGPAVPTANQPCTASNGCAGTGVCSTDKTTASCVPASNPDTCGHCGGPATPELGAACSGARACRGHYTCDVALAGTRCLCGPVISQIAGTGPASTTDEFLELYNPAPNAMDVTGFTLWYASSSSTNPPGAARLVTLGARPTGSVVGCTQTPVVIPAHGYLLVARAPSSGGTGGYVARTGEPAPDCTYLGSGIAASSGQLWLTSGATAPQSLTDPALVDMAGYGSAARFEGSGPAHTPPAQPGSLVRRATAASTAASLLAGEIAMGNGFDTDDNSADFLVFSNRVPRGLSTQSPATPGPGATCSDPATCGGLMTMDATGATQCVALAPNGCNACGGPVVTGKDSPCTTTENCDGTMQCVTDGSLACAGAVRNECQLCGGPAVTGLGNACEHGGCDGQLVCNTAGTGTDCSVAPGCGSEGIAGALAAADGTTLNLPIHDVYVTYLKPAMGAGADSETPGFFVQADAAGPGLFVAADPAMLTPIPTVGDKVAFTVVMMVTVSYGGTTTGPRMASIGDYTRISTGNSVAGLATDLTNATDLMTAVAAYESRLVTLTGKVAGTPVDGGAGHVQMTFTTAGLPTAAQEFVLRIPTTLMVTVGLGQGCDFTLDAGAMWRRTLRSTDVPPVVTEIAQVVAYDADDFSGIDCPPPPPRVVSAVGYSATGVTVTFDGNIAGGSLQANGSQFTITPSLAVTEASVSAVTVFLTTASQTPGTTYTVTVAGTVKDTLGAGIDAAHNTATFAGFTPPAPRVTSATVTSATSVTIGFDQTIAADSVTDGSQFAITPALAVTAASASGMSVTLTTAAQTPGTSYTVAVAGTVRSTAGVGVDAQPQYHSATFTGFTPCVPAVVISQVYGGGGNTGASYNKDFIELHNRGTASVNVTGWSVQYAGATGTTWQKTTLSGSIDPGKFLLVSGGGGANGSDLPQPELTGSLSLSGTAGKVALVRSDTLIVSGTTCPTGADIADIVGYGGTSTTCSETTPAGTPGNTTAVVRAGGGCTDTGDNVNDFAVSAPTPRNGAAAAVNCVCQ